ncbi:MAG: lipopolysaccharide biosynthesis protein [Bacilli bacterium]|nr:lipopolysaccharide biosynthesis protein [Bacilli bacterium]
MKEKKLSLASNLVWNSIGSFTYLVCQWLLTLLIVRLSNNLSDAGNLSLAISITNIFYNFACFNVRPYLVSDNIGEYKTEEYTSFRIVTCILSTILCFLYILIFDYTMTQLICILLYMLFKVGEAVVDLFHAFEQRKSRMDIGGISLFCRGVLSIASFYVGFRIFHNINIAIIGMIISTWLFILFYDYPKVQKIEKIKVRMNYQKVKELFIKFLPLAIGTFIGSMATSLPRQFLESIEGASILGIYATVATPAVIVQTAASYIYNPLLVIFSDFRTKKDSKGFWLLFLKTSLIIIALSTVCIIGSQFLAKWGLQLLYGAKIANYDYLFTGVIFYTSLTGYMWFCHNILIILRKMKELLLINVTAFILCLSTATLFIKKYSMNGTSYCLIFFTSIMIVGMLIIIVRDIRELGISEKKDVKEVVK